MRKIRVGIIGIGLIGKAHLRNYMEIPEVEVVAVCDIDEQEAREVAGKFNVKHVYLDFREMLQRDDIDAVDVCLHNNFHSSVTNECLRAGKHVYVEKPIAGTYYDGLEMVECAEECGKLLHVQLNTLYQPETRVAKKLIDNDQLGEIFHARSMGFRRRFRPYVDGYGTKFFARKETATGGALIDMGVYHIAQILYLLNIPEADKISGKVYQKMAMDEVRKKESGFNVEELAVGFVKFKGDFTLDIMEAWAVHQGHLEGSSIIGSRGGIKMPTIIDGEKTKFSFHSTVSDIDFDSGVDVTSAVARWKRLDEKEVTYSSSQHHWIAALLGEADLLPTAKIALDTMLISEGIYTSNERGEEVTAEEIKSISSSTAVHL